MKTCSLISRLLFATAIVVVAASCTDVESAGHAAPALALELDDAVLAVDVEALDHPAPDVVTMALRIESLGPIAARAELDPSGRGTVVLSGDGFRHEILISDALLRVTYEHRGVTDLAYLARPRGDLLTVLADFPTTIAPASRALPAMPLHYVALRGIELAAAAAPLDARWAALAQATWALEQRFADDPTAAPPAVAPVAAWRALAPDLDLDLDVAPASVTIAAHEAAAIAVACEMTAVTGAAKIKGSRSPKLYMADAITCTDGPINVTAKSPGGGNFTKTEVGITWAGSQTPLGSCPGHCGDVFGGATCYKSTVRAPATPP